MEPEVPTNAEQLDRLVAAFVSAAAHAGVSLPNGSVEAEFLAAPHRPPTKLPSLKQAIYWFAVGKCCLKVGKAGQHSNARYTSQHYNPRSSGSNLAKSILKYEQRVKAVVPVAKQGEIDRLDESTVGNWIKENTSRCNLLVDISVNVHALSFLETFVQARLQPLFEGRMER
jgi:hypothetical protein